MSLVAKAEVVFGIFQENWNYKPTLTLELRLRLTLRDVSAKVFHCQPCCSSLGVLAAVYIASFW